MSSEGKTIRNLTIDQIRGFLPHRHPFLLIDRILEIRCPKPIEGLDSLTDKVGIHVTAIKNISYGEAVFQGHFPTYSIFPGVMIVEAMAQVASFAVYPFMEANPKQAEDFQCILVAVDNARFRKPVTPGDRMQLDIIVTKFRKQLWCFSCKATVDGQLVAEADIMANLMAKEK